MGGNFLYLLLYCAARRTTYADESLSSAQERCRLAYQALSKTGSYLPAEHKVSFRPFQLKGLPLPATNEQYQAATACIKETTRMEYIGRWGKLGARICIFINCKNGEGLLGTGI